MTETHLPDVVNEFTKICRICVNAPEELYSIHDIGRICNKTVKVSDLLSECTSIEVIHMLFKQIIHYYVDSVCHSSKRMIIFR